jgi:hypothetical protein
MQTTIMTKTLKTALFGALLAGSLGTASAQIALPWYEPFPLSYTNNESGASTETTYYPQGGPNYPSVRLGTGNSLTVWSVGGGQGVGSPLIIGAAGLSYPGLGDPAAPASAGVYIRTNNTTGGRSRGAIFQSQNSGKIYASFLLKLETPPDLDRRLFVILTDGTVVQPTGGPLGVWIETDGRISISKSVNSPNTPTAQPAPVATSPNPLGTGTHLIVVRYTFNPDAGDDEVALWIDPTGGQLGVAEGSVPTPTISGTTGTDAAAIAAFYEFHPSTEIPVSLIFDEVRVGLTWAAVTPAGAVCNSAFVSTSPANATVLEGVSASLTAVFGGTAPTYRWQVSTDGGTLWNFVTGGVGTNGPTYLTPPNTVASSGYKYRAIGTVACNGSSATSTVATVTVTPAIAATNGVYLDDVFADAEYNNIPITRSNSVWLQSATGTLDASSGTHLTANAPVGSVTWLGYFTDDSVTNQPIYLPVGKSLKVTLVFKGNNITTNGGNFRIGLFDFADGGTRPVTDGSGVANSGVGVRGYMVALNYGTNFSANPYSIYARNTLVADLMGTTGNYIGLGGGPSGYAGAPAFQNGVAYNAEFTVARTAASSVTFTVNISGGGTNWTYSRVDTDYAYPRFDAIGIRSAGAALAADSFEISRLLVEVVAGAPAAAPLNIAATGNNVTLTWTNAAFTLQAAPNVTGAYTNVPGATSPYVVPASGAARFFRLVWP